MVSRCQSTVSRPKARMLALAVSSLFAGVFCLSAVSPTNAYAATSAAIPKQYAIGAGKLSDVLAQFAARSGVPLSFDPAPLSEIHSPGLNGSYTIEAGFKQILNGSNYALQDKGNGSYSLRKVPVSAVADDRALPAVTVKGGVSLATEGTGSYTTRATGAATGLALSMRETPQSVSVMTRQRIEDQGLQSIGDVLKNAPGITSTQLDSERITFYSRGFTIDMFQYDGIPASIQGGGDSETDPVMYDRVEIVRGATGLLTGSGNPSASINLVRKRANSKTFEGHVSASAASWSNYRATVDLSTPLTETGHVRARIVAAHEDKKSYINGYQRKRSTFYGVVDADVSAATTVSLGASYQNTDAEGATYGGLPFWYSDGTAINWKQYGRSMSIWPKWSTEKVDIYNVFANLDHRFDNGWTMNLAATYKKHDLEFTRLFPWGFPDPSTGVMTQNPSRVKFPGELTNKSVDAKVSGPFRLAGRTHEALFGVGYSREDKNSNRQGASDSVPAWPLFDWSSYPEPTSWGTTLLSEKYIRKQTSSYGVLRFSLADPLTLIVGGRYSRWERTGAGYNGASPYDYNKNSFIPYAGLVYDVTDALSVYASYTSIYNPQNYRMRDGRYLEPTEGASYEAGIKGEFFNGKLNAALSVFRVNQNNFAEIDPGQFVPGTTIRAYRGIDGVTTKGVEIELSGEIASGLQLGLSATHVNSTDAKGANASTASPRNIARLFTTYHLPGDWEKLTVGGGVNWQSRVYNKTGIYHYDAPNGMGEYEQKAYALVNLMARYQFSPKLTLQLNIDNVFDKWYQSAVNFNEQLVWGSPRTFQATLNYKF